MTLVDMFVIDHVCIGRDLAPWWKRWIADALCAVLGHALWRVNQSSREIAGHSLPVCPTFCTRCGKAGYVVGDYR